MSLTDVPLKEARHPNWLIVKRLFNMQHTFAGFYLAIVGQISVFSLNATINFGAIHETVLIQAARDHRRVVVFLVRHLASTCLLVRPV